MFAYLYVTGLALVLNCKMFLILVPPRPPKSSTGKKPLPPPAENGHREPKAGKKNRIKDLSSVFQEQVNQLPNI